MMTMLRFRCIHVLLFLVPLARATGNLRGQTVEELEKTALAELANTFRSGSSHDRVSEERTARLEASLHQMFISLPKQSDGTLSRNVVRYLLHRFFVKQHGWYIRGLEAVPPNASSFANEPPGRAQVGNGEQMNFRTFESWDPAYLQRFMAQLHEGQDVSLHDTAIIAGALETLVQKEIVSYLERAYTGFEIPLSQQLDAHTAQEVLDVFMMIYLLGGTFKYHSKEKVTRAHDIFTKKMKGWGKMQDWMIKLRHDLLPDKKEAMVGFDDLSKVAEETSRRYGTFNDQGCNALREELLTIESKMAGRVRLAEFYKKGLTGVFKFNEKVDYLRVLGALDESDPNQTYVIIPNYVTSRSNCIVPSSFYLICCRSECENLLGALEQRVPAETATPEQILDVVSGLSSSTISSSRNLSERLIQRLQHIAQFHEGVVPVHGRLFAQWMHHAFPRECPYPHEVGATGEMSPDEWMHKVGETQSAASKEEILERIKNDHCGVDEPLGLEARSFQDSAENELPWDDSEALLQPPQEMPQSAPGHFAKFAAASSLGSTLVLFAIKYLQSRSRSRKKDLSLHLY